MLDALAERLDTEHPGAVASLMATELFFDEKPQTVATQRRERDVLTIIRSSPQHPFPVHAGPVRVTVVHGGPGSEVLPDFLAETLKVKDRVAVTDVIVTLGSPESIAEAVAKADGEVVVLIRGGGNDQDFYALEHPTILDAFCDKDAYRIVALGHSGNMTLLGHICEFSANTPTAAAVHICEQVREQAGARIAIERARVEKKSREKEVARLQALMEGERKTFARKLGWLIDALMILSAVVLAAGFLAGVSVGLPTETSVTSDPAAAPPNVPPPPGSSRGHVSRQRSAHEAATLVHINPADLVRSLPRRPLHDRGECECVL